MREVLQEVNDELDYLYGRVEELGRDFEGVEVERDELQFELDRLKYNLQDPKHLLNLLAKLKEGD